ncbi:hypothetical protein QTP88_009744 [Uroleucon formosanum]
MEKFLNIKSTTKRLNEDNNKEENKRKFRKYDDNYLDFGFTYIKMDNEERPKCVICLKVLAADSMIPNKLKRHFETNHGSFINKKRDYFVRQREQLEKQSTSFIKQISVPTKALLASYKLAFRIAQSKKPHTIAEELILPSAIDMVSTMIGESTANQLKNVPLSNNTISRRIHDISDNINEQFINKLRNKNFAIQLDEATDTYNVLVRVFELRQELNTYLSEEGHNDFNKFIDIDFVIKLAYLCDIIEKLNILNTSLQGKETHILQLYDKVVAFIKKIELWQRKLTKENGKTTCFSFLKSFLEDNDLELPMNSLKKISDHLMTLKNHFEKYFPDDIVQYNWIKDPFSEKPLSNFTTTEEEQLIDIPSDSSLRMKFSSFSLLGFWNSIKDEYPEISNKALRALLPFATSYLCEAGFSAVAVLKSKYRSRLNIEKEMRVAVTTLLPNFEELLNGKQAHCSH